MWNSFFPATFPHSILTTSSTERASIDDVSDRNWSRERVSRNFTAGTSGWVAVLVEERRICMFFMMSYSCQSFCPIMTSVATCDEASKRERMFSPLSGTGMTTGSGRVTNGKVCGWAETVLSKRMRFIALVCSNWISLWSFLAYCTSLG